VARCGEPFSSPGHAFQLGSSPFHLDLFVILYMKANAANITSEEPIGIVISRGPRQEHTPMVLAYVWGPAPEGDDSPDTKAA